jgi:hypothetical protein
MDTDSLENIVLVTSVSDLQSVIERAVLQFRKTDIGLKTWRKQTLSSDLKD